jgi:prephenate dehydratase
MAVAIQGEAGSYSHAAALQVHGPDLRLVPRPSFDALFSAVVEGTAARGVVPIENSLAGSVHENYDLLRAYALHVVGETAVRIHHCLVVRPGTAVESIRRVASHPVALAQCRRFFAGRAGLVAVPAYDTAGSVKDLMENRAAADAAIGSALAARLYGGEVVAEGIEDHPENHTRFLVVAPEPLPLDGEGPTKTSLVLTLPNVPGSLHRALGTFARRGLDLTKIESRPLEGRPWEYAFYLDVLGDPQGEVAEALAELRAFAAEVRVLGAYRAYDASGA